LVLRKSAASLRLATGKVRRARVFLTPYKGFTVCELRETVCDEVWVM
jgi:hypothetical protein